jgi:hypothetical protein
MNRKSDDTSKTRFRSDRFFNSQGEWYCATREGTTLGPFGSRDQAQSALIDYLLSLGIRPDDVWADSHAL